MKVLLVNKFHYRRGGDCVYTFALAELLRKHGHEVFHFSMRHPQNLPCAEERFFVSHIDFAALNTKKNPITAAKVLARSIYSLEARRRIRALLSEIRPDIAHLQNIHSHITPSILTELERAHIPVLWTLHDYKLICPEDSFLSNGVICEACKGGRFYECTRRRCKKGSLAASFVASLEAYAHQWLRIPEKIYQFIAPSQFLRTKFIEFGWPAEKIVFIRNFLPNGARRPYHSDGKYGLYLGTLKPTKGVRTLLGALKAIPDIPFHILGAGDELRTYQEIAQAMNLTKVSFPGFLTGSALQEEINGAAFGVIPSEWYENCPYAVMELMAAGKPVIASRIGGLPELVSDGETGLLFEPGAHAELAERIRLIWSNPSLRVRLGKNAARRAENEFAADRYYETIADLYQMARSAMGTP